MEHKFTVEGREFVGTREGVESALKGVKPESVYVHSVEVNGQDYPVTQALAVAFGLPREDCPTHGSRRVFRHLGFTLKASEKRPRRKHTRSAMQEALPKRSVEIGPVEDEFLEIPTIHLGWYPWERWEDIVEFGYVILDLPGEKSGVYEAKLWEEEERLTIGRASDLRIRVLQRLVRGTNAHSSGDKIREAEDVSRVMVRWATTDRPAAAEEELHRRHVEKFGHLPKYTVHT